MKLATKQCPACGQTKAYPERNRCCSTSCSSAYARGIRADAPVAQAGEKERHEHTDDQWTVSLDATRIRSLDELVAHCQVDTRIWEVERFICNKWEMGSNLGDGKITVEPLFQVKAWFRKNKAAEFAICELQTLKEDFKAHKPKVVPFPAQKPAVKGASGNLLEISIPDIHIGKLAWSGETGYADYDVNIAVQIFSDAMDALVGRAVSFAPDRILLVLGNDLIHFDNRAGTTTAGTPQDTDTRYHKVFKIVRKLCTHKIEQLSLIAPVDVVICVGNHDSHASWSLGDSLECWFDGDKRVTIDNEPLPRKYYQWGGVLLGFCHGDRGRKKDYPLLMATEVPQMFGSSFWREMHTGHLHTTRVDEYHGVRVRILPSLSGTDFWHSASGFTANLRTAEGFVWNKLEGLLSTIYYYVPDDRPATKKSRLLDQAA